MLTIDLRFDPPIESHTLLEKEERHEMFSESQIASRTCDWEVLVNCVRRQCRAFVVREISPVCEVSASWMDEHSVDIQWKSGELSHNIQIVLEGNSWPLHLRFSGSASVEPPKGPEDFRWWNGLASTAVNDLDELENFIDRCLPVAHQSVRGLIRR